MTVVCDESTVVRRSAISLTTAKHNYSPWVRQGEISINAQLLHFALISYEIPSERLRFVVPEILKIDKSSAGGITQSWVSIISFLDQGSWSNGDGAFEQTSYLLHVSREGEPINYLLGISVGSLSAVARRNMWPMPWHLSAMEFQVSYDQSAGHYRYYRLRTQSQWANASWEITDTGKPIYLDQAAEIPVISSLCSGTTHNYFSRRDGESGMFKIRYRDASLTAGKLNHARSDVLERLGLIRREELSRPSVVAIQHKTSCQIFSPAVLSL